MKYIIVIISICALLISVYADEDSEEPQYVDSDYEFMPQDKNNIDSSSVESVSTPIDQTELSSSLDVTTEPPRDRVIRDSCTYWWNLICVRHCHKSDLMRTMCDNIGCGLCLDQQILLNVI